MNNPAEYAKANSIAHKNAGDFMEEFDDEMSQSSGPCLDIGSGPGDVAVDIILPKLHPQATIVCSDISDAMVEFGKENYKNNARVSFIKLNIETPNLPKDLIGRFNQVTSTFCLQWCQDIRHAFGNIFNLLRPGGSAFLIFTSDFPALSAYKELLATPRYGSYMKDADQYLPVFQSFRQQRKTLKTLAEDAGFEVQHCSIRDKVSIWEDPDVFDKFLVAINPFRDCIPANLREDFERDLVKKAIRDSILLNKSNNNKHENGIACVFRICVVKLRKPSTSEYSNQ